jgi:serine/threonine protein kinase
MTKTVDEFFLGRTLGCGAFGKVKVGTRADGCKFAIKILRHSNPNYFKLVGLFKKEISMAIDLSHPNLVSYHDFRSSSIVKKDGKHKETVDYLI